MVKEPTRRNITVNESQRSCIRFGNNLNNSCIKMYHLNVNVAPPPAMCAFSAGPVGDPLRQEPSWIISPHQLV